MLIVLDEWLVEADHRRVGQTVNHIPEVFLIRHGCLQLVQWQQRRREACNRVLKDAEVFREVVRGGQPCGRGSDECVYEVRKDAYARGFQLEDSLLALSSSADAFARNAWTEKPPSIAAVCARRAKNVSTVGDPSPMSSSPCKD